jgi:hypothetical protein
MRRPYTPPDPQVTSATPSSFIRPDGRWAANLLEAGVSTDEWRALGLSGIPVQDYMEMQAIHVQADPAAVDETRLWRLADLRGDATAEAYYFSRFSPEQQQEWLFPWDVIISDEPDPKPPPPGYIPPETESEREARMEIEREYGSFDDQVAAALAQQAQRWLQDNQSAIDQYNQRIAQHGTFAEQMDAWERAQDLSRKPPGA